MDALIDKGAELGMDEMAVGMAHRGRLNVLTHILRKPYEMIMSEVLGRPTVKTAGDDLDPHAPQACWRKFV